MHLEPGKFYHIYNRGNNKENLFKESRNYAYLSVRSDEIALKVIELSGGKEKYEKVHAAYADLTGFQTDLIGFQNL